MPNYPKDQNLNPITFSDFSQGIVQRVGVVGATQFSPAKLGAASITNTYRCIALPGGGLGPLPKKVRDFSVVDTVAGPTYVVDGTALFGPLYHSTSVPVFDQGPAFPPTISATPFEMHLIYEADISGTRHLYWRRYRYFSDSLADTLIDQTLNPSVSRYAGAYTTLTRANPGAPQFFGYPVVVVSMGGPVTDISTTGLSATMMFPDPANPTTTTVNTIFNSMGPVLGHQNRVVLLSRGAFSHAAPNYTYAPTNEFINFTLPNDTAPDSLSTLIGQEYPVGYGAWGSLTASDLLLIKHLGGAYLVQGDLANPIVRRLPNVVSTGGVESVGAHTGVGFIYGVNQDGVYSWQGGDGSTNLSPQLENGFWISPLVLTNPYKGTFLGWGSWVLTPNNFLFDTTLNSWWRLEDTSVATYFIWQRDPVNNVVYGARPSFDNTNPVFSSGYDKSTPAVNFSWQSQSFNPDSRRRVVIRAVSIVAQGNGTVTVTLTPTDSGEATPVNPNAFTINTSGAVRQLANAQIAGTQFTLRIVSDGGSNPAPIVYEVSIDFEALSAPSMAS